MVTCGREDTEDPTLFCTHLAERRFMAPHANECDYRPVPCNHCKRKVSARHLPEHEAHCAERRVLCDDCGARVLERNLPEHKEVPDDLAPPGALHPLSITLVRTVVRLCLPLSHGVARSRIAHRNEVQSIVNASSTQLQRAGG